MTRFFASNPRWLTGATLAVALATAGCAVGPNHKAPEVKSPQSHRGDKAPSATSLSFTRATI